MEILEKFFYPVTVFKFYIYCNQLLKNFLRLAWKIQNFFIY